MEELKDRIRFIHVRVMSILAFIITLGYFGAMAALMLMPIPQDSHEVLLVMLGTLGTAWGGIIGYFFGSSAGSAQKDIINRPQSPEPIPLSQPKEIQ